MNGQLNERIFDGSQTIKILDQIQSLKIHDLLSAIFLWMSKILFFKRTINLVQKADIIIFSDSR